jgi:hypothetical protein
LRQFAHWIVFAFVALLSHFFFRSAAKKLFLDWLILFFILKDFNFLRRIISNCFLLNSIAS